MYKLPAIYVGPYAEQDADLTLRLFYHMKTIIEKESLSSVAKLGNSALKLPSALV